MSRKFRFSQDSVDSIRRFQDALLRRGEAPALEKEEAAEAADTGEKHEVPETADAAPEVKKEEQKPVEEPKQDEKPEPKVWQDTGCAAIRTDTGKVRTSNQDAPLWGEGLLGVADGMGGHRGGEVASGMTAELLPQLLKGQKPSLELMRSAVESVNRRIYLRSWDEESLEGMGTTLTCIWYDSENLFIGHVGDSRAYRLREGELRQMTEDHSLVAELVRQGAITREQAECHPMRNIITRAVGTEKSVDVDVLWHKRRTGDRWLLCSDGLHGMVGEKKMAELMKLPRISDAADALLNEALCNGGRDNVTVVLFDDKEDAE